MEKRIYRQLTEYGFEQPAALCALVDWQGSVPRRDYPLMLVLADGTTIGTVGGGPMEFRVIEAVRKVIADGQPVRAEYDLSGTGAEGADGICGGSTQVLIEPFTPAIRDLIRSVALLEPQAVSRQLVTAINGFEPAIVRRWLVDEAGAPENLPDELNRALALSRQSRQSLSVEIGKTLHCINYLAPPARLHIFGAGHVAQAVAELAHFIELDTFIYDDRADLATTERFPHALRLDTSSITDLPQKIAIATTDFVLVATRGHRHDFELMSWLLALDTAYLGLMSSRRKWKILADALAGKGYSREQLDQVHAPVGLDIASETVPEIAVSVISEIIQHYRTGHRSTQSLSAPKAP
ncbi:MAG: XdhC family protein [Candidatus Neomarinimicrobiota bacterium]